eukprot:1158890-Pelagomonas_calceolata.AAC.10
MDRPWPLLVVGVWCRFIETLAGLLVRDSALLLGGGIRHPLSYFEVPCLDHHIYHYARGWPKSSGHDIKFWPTPLYPPSPLPVPKKGTNVLLFEFPTHLHTQCVERVSCRRVMGQVLSCGRMPVLPGTQKWLASPQSAILTYQANQPTYTKQ